MKTKLTLIALLSMLSFAYAASGACSGHGGVDCRYVDYDGSVICMDGWENSSVSYDSMVKCRGYTPKGSHKAAPPIEVQFTAPDPTEKPKAVEFSEVKPVVKAKPVSAPVKPKTTTTKATSTVQKPVATFKATSTATTSIPLPKEMKPKNLFQKMKFW